MARKTAAPEEEFDEHIIDTDITDEMSSSYIEYAYSVIYSRAIPDARDGLKPVQRRTLFTMDDLNLRHDRGHVKSARVVGEVMGRLHPHGDGAIYDALVRLVQPWSMRLPLVDGHGNFGSPDDPPAAMRYTECRMDAAAEAMTASIDEDTVDFRPNYDGRETEPSVLPAALPNLLVNGASGIAVGMATNIAPHNLVEVVQALPPPHRPSGRRPRRPDEVRPRPRPPHRRQDRRARRHPRRLRHRQRLVPDARHGPHRERHAAPPRHRRHRAALQRRAREGHRGHQEARAVQEAAGHLRHQEPHRPAQGPQPRHRGQELVQPRGDARAALQATRRWRRRSASTPSRSSTGSPARSGCKEMLTVFLDHRYDVVRRRTDVPPPQGGRAAAPRRRPAHRDPRHRRGHPAHPRQRRPRPGPRTPHRRLRPERPAGRLHPRPAARPAHQVLPHRAGEGGRAAARDHRRARRDPGRRRRCCARSSATSSTRWPSSSARRVAPCCSRRPARPSPPPRRSRSPTTRAGCCSRPPACSPARPTTPRSATSAAAPSTTRSSRPCAATARGQVGLVTSGGTVRRLNVVEIPAIPPTSSAPHLQGGVPLRELLHLDDRPLTLMTFDDDGPGLALGTRTGVVKRVKPDHLSNRDEWDLITPGRRRRGRRRGSAAHRRRAARVRHVRRPAAAVRRVRWCGRRAAPAAASPASSSPTAPRPWRSAWCATSTPRTSSASPAPATPCPAPDRQRQGQPARHLPGQGPRHRRRALPAPAQGRGRPHPGVGRRRVAHRLRHQRIAGRAARAHRASRRVRRRRPPSRSSAVAGPVASLPGVSTLNPCVPDSCAIAGRCPPPRRLPGRLRRQEGRHAASSRSGCRPHAPRSTRPRRSTSRWPRSRCPTASPDCCRPPARATTHPRSRARSRSSPVGRRSPPRSSPPSGTLKAKTELLAALPRRSTRQSLKAPDPAALLDAENGVTQILDADQGPEGGREVARRLGRPHHHHRHAARQRRPHDHPVGRRDGVVPRHVPPHRRRRAARRHAHRAVLPRAAATSPTPSSSRRPTSPSRSRSRRAA